MPAACSRGHVTALCSRLEGEPVRALPRLVHLAPHPAALRGAGRLLPAAADLRPAAGVHPQRHPALLLQPGVPARCLLRVGLLQVTQSTDVWSSGQRGIQVHGPFRGVLSGPKSTEVKTARPETEGSA